MARSEARDISPCTQCTESGALSGLRLIYASGFPYAKPGGLRKAMQGARIRTSAVRDIRWIPVNLDATIVKSFKAWIPRSEAADKDKLAAILSFAAKTVTTIQRSPDVKARNFFRSLLASIGGKTLEAATAEATKIRVQTPDFSISTLETVPKESLPVKKATDKEPAAPAVDPPSDMAAGVTSATQDGGATPTVTPIADPSRSLPPLHSRSNSGSPDGACLQDRSPYHKTRCSIPHNGPLKTGNETSSSASSAKASKPTGVFGKTTDIAVQTSLDQQPHLHHYHGRFSQSMLPTSATTSCYSPYRQEHQALGHLRDLHSLPQIPLYCPWIRCHSASSHWILDAEESPSVFPSCFGGHEHVGSVYVGHSGATTNYSRREAFASIRQALDRVVPFDNNHPVLIFGDWNTDPQRLQRIVHSWGHGLTVMQFSGSQITRLSTVHGRRSLTVQADTTQIHDIHQLTSQFLESANAVADNLSLRLSPPATRSNRRLLSGTTKRAILASNTARQAFIAAATHTNPDPVQCNTLRDEWSRLKAAATQLEEADGRKQWVKHADNLDRAVSDGRTDLVFSAARAMSGNSSRSAAVTPLYNSDGIVQYDPTSILRVMQGHYGSLAADTTGQLAGLAILA
ncbi:hypothetical protein BASA83_006082 [Batrachochytrium salamandrivorans]|nr:hypothetical protein BASA83_006082 [Batrachochytrium salamandrivorans]